jgi:hypothetical protein
MTQKNIFNFVLVICLFIGLTFCGQKPMPYLIDSTISKTIDENIKSTMGQMFNAIKSVEIINDSINQENYGLGKNLDAITEAYLSNDTLYIVSALAARDATFGYKIILTQQKCIVNYFSITDENNLKIKKNDKPIGYISFECPINKLIFSQKPKFQIGESIEGILELTTNDYWSVSNDIDTKIKHQLTGYFKTKLKSSNERLIHY